MFTVVTKTPTGLNYQRNSDKSDSVTALAIANHWPARTINDLSQRSLYLAERLRRMTDDSKGQVRLVRSRTDLEAFLEDRKSGRAQTAALLGLEGAHAMEADDPTANVNKFYNAGFRMIGLAHFFDNAYAGSAHGVNKGGLTQDGEKLVRALEEMKMIVDLAHSSPKTINDVLAIAKRPVLVSHTGVRGTCNNQRNLSDAQLRNIAAKGGLIGIGYWDTATCGTDAAAIARAIKYAVGIVGVDHVALGSDYDGAVTAPFDVSGTALITEALMKEGFSEQDIRKIMGENTLHFFHQNLPD
jgi:microsomal dipeptidase-like Zn-dependent dipeptidase